MMIDMTPEEQREYNKNWRRNNKDKLREYEKRRYLKNGAERRAISNKARAARRLKALQIIAEAWGVKDCCYKIHPNIPFELKKHKCWGQLQFEHPNGGGRKEYWAKSRTVIEKIAKKQADPKTYMVLCQLHQIWRHW